MVDAPLLIRVWLDDRRVGCGEREAMVVRVGRSKARILTTASLTGLDIDLRTLARSRPVAIRPAGLLARIERQKRVRRRHGLAMSRGTVRMALDRLTVAIAAGRRPAADEAAEPAHA